MKITFDKLVDFGLFCFSVVWYMLCYGICYDFLEVFLVFKPFSVFKINLSQWIIFSSPLDDLSKMKGNTNDTICKSA